MTAHTTFDREPVHAGSHIVVDPLPLTERIWFPVVRVAIIASWVGACVFMLALLAN